MTYLLALGLTLIVEVPLFWTGLYRFAGVRFGRGWRLAIAVNLLSHPVVYLALYPWLTGILDTTLAASLVESVVLLAEWWLLCRWTRGRAERLLAMSLVSNCASFIAGRMLLG